MKTKLFLSLFAAVAAFQFAPSALAQTTVDDQHPRRQGRHAGRFANLSQEERTKLRAAHQKAMADPAVLAAKDRSHQSRRDFRELKKAAMLRADPTIQPILDKLPNRGNRGT